MFVPKAAKDFQDKMDQFKKASAGFKGKVGDNFKVSCACLLLIRALQYVPDLKKIFLNNVTDWSYGHAIQSRVTFLLRMTQQCDNNSVLW